MANWACTLVPARHLAAVSANFGDLSTDFSQGLPSHLDSVLTLKGRYVVNPTRHAPWSLYFLNFFQVERYWEVQGKQQAGPLTALNFEAHSDDDSPLPSIPFLPSTFVTSLGVPVPLFLDQVNPLYILRGATRNAFPRSQLSWMYFLIVCEITVSTRLSALWRQQRLSFHFHFLPASV